MSVKIRLRRMGKRNNPFYRIVVADEATKRDGKVIETIGYYNPQQRDLQCNRASYDMWQKKGAQPTETVRKLLS